MDEFDEVAADKAADDAYAAGREFASKVLTPLIDAEVKKLRDGEYVDYACDSFWDGLYENL